MPAIEKLSIDLPADMVSVVRHAVEGGEYASNSDVIRDALHDWTQKRNLRAQGLMEMRRLWTEAVADDSDGLDPDAVFDALESKYEALALAKDH